MKASTLLALPLALATQVALTALAADPNQGDDPDLLPDRDASVAARSEGGGATPPHALLPVAPEAPRAPEVEDSRAGVPRAREEPAASEVQRAAPREEPPATSAGGDSCATCDHALEFDRRDAPSDGRGAGAAAEGPTGPSLPAAEASPEPAAAATLPARHTSASEGGEGFAAEDGSAGVGPAVTAHAEADGQLSVLVVMPSGARTKILLDGAGRVLGVRSVPPPER